MIELARARWRLAIIWFPGAALLFVILVIQSLSGAYEDSIQRVWGWALPNFLPTVALMVSVFAAEALKPTDGPGILVRRNFCTLSIWLSVFYLMMLFLSVLSPPLINYLSEGGEAVDYVGVLETSNIWLGPLQGIVVVAIGVLFYLKERPQDDETKGGDHGDGAHETP